MEIWRFDSLPLMQKLDFNLDLADQTKHTST